MFKFLMYKIGQFWVNRLSSQTAYRVAVILSDLQYFFSFRDRRAVRQNLKEILKSDGDLSFLTREVFRNFGRYLVEFFRMEKHMDLEYVRSRIKVKDLHYLDQVLAKGKGGIVLTAHMGNWELGAAALSLMGYPIFAIALPHKERPVNDLFNHQREAKGITIIPSNVAVRRCIETLRSNQLVAMVADRDFSMRGELMDFLGKKTLLPKGAAIFSLKTGAPIIPIFLLRDKDEAYDLVVYEPIYPTRKVEDQCDDALLIEMISKYLPLIENKIRQFPDQWLMFRPFWFDKSQAKRLKESDHFNNAVASQNSGSAPS